MQLIGRDDWNNNKLLSSFLSQSLLGSLFCIQWLRMLPAKLHVLYVCLEQVRVICPLVYSSLFIMAQSWPKGIPGLLSEHPERGFSPSLQSHENSSSLHFAFQCICLPRARGRMPAQRRLWWNTSARIFVLLWSQQEPTCPKMIQGPMDGEQVFLHTQGLQYKLLLFSPEISCLKRVMSLESLLSKLKTARMKSIKPQPFSVSQFHFLLIPASESIVCHICGRDVHVTNHTCAF